MKLTLLELVQDMLSAVDDEPVTSVGDSEEAGMCVNIANRAFEGIISKFRWRHIKQLSTLSSTTALNEMTVPVGTIAIDPYSIWYDDQLVYFVEPEDFIATTIQRSTDESNIVKSNNIKVYNDRKPSFFTSFDDETLIFDSYPDGSGLATNAAVVLCWVGLTSRLTQDGAYFDLPRQAYPALSAKCIALALNEIKGDSQGSTISEREHRRQMASLGRNARLVDVRDDLRKFIIPRPTARNTTSTVRRINN